MPAVIDDQNFCKPAEACRMISISRDALFKWLKEGIISDVGYHDGQDWRLFTAAQLETVRAKTNDVIAINRRSWGSI